MNMPKIKDGLEQRSYSFEIRAEQTEDEIGVITGRPIVYNSRTDLGYFDEVIERGALNGADLRDVRFLVNHDISKIPLARSRNNNANSTMQLMPDDQGMEIRVNLDVRNNSDARNLYSAIERGDITGMSFMFSIDDEEWTELESDHPTRHIKKISNVVEVSAVTFPAYEDTEISVRNEEALESAKLALENAKRSQEQTLDSERESELILAKAKFEALLKVR
jgi:HK97 family phage prohead protease